MSGPGDGVAIFRVIGASLDFPCAACPAGYDKAMPAYEELLDATLQHLTDLKSRGVKHVAVSADTLRLLSQPPPPKTSAPAEDETKTISIFDPATVNANKAAAFAALRERVMACVKCSHLASSRKNVVFGVGNLDATLMFVGEAPGADEDLQGEPFVGRAGELLTKIIQATGFKRSDVYIANILKCRPPGNRDPKPEEVSRCLPFLCAQIALLKPKMMLAVGRIAAQNLLATDAPLARLRGKLHHFGEANTPLVITYHPAYLLRTPSDKRKAWEDLKFARATYQRLVTN